MGPLDIVTPRRTNYIFYYMNIPCVCYKEVRNNVYTSSYSTLVNKKIISQMLSLINEYFHQFDVRIFIVKLH